MRGINLFWAQSIHIKLLDSARGRVSKSSLQAALRGSLGHPTLGIYSSGLKEEAADLQLPPLGRRSGGKITSISVLLYTRLSLSGWQDQLILAAGTPLDLRTSSK